MADPSAEALHFTPLHAEHVALGARMVPFAGYDMPVQYPSGIIVEHTHTRAACGMFDVSHMGQALLSAASHEAVATALETLIPADIVGLERGRQRYSQFLNEQGGVLDDLMISRSPDPAKDGTLMLVVNASRKQADFALLREKIADRTKLTVLADRALLALQGPLASQVLAQHCPAAADLAFMGVCHTTFDAVPIDLSRSGYTGEDGYEISVAADHVAALWRTLLADTRVRPVGLGARDSLRLEAGLCLYGHELSETISPVEAGLVWSIQKRRREQGGFPGAARIRDEIAGGTARVRVGLVPEGRSPVREGAIVQDQNGTDIGMITSGGFGPTTGGPVAIGYVPPAFARAGTRLSTELRGKPVALTVTQLPFVPHRFHRN